MKKLLIIVSLIILTFSCKDLPESKEAYPFLITLPQDYNESTDSSFSLVFFLHGAGSRGNNLELLKRHGIPKRIEEGVEFPAIVISPQVPTGSKFKTERLQKTLVEILSNYRIDSSRIYCTGLSMGGAGTWDWAAKYPENFAAIVPVCGYSDPSTAKKIAQIPTWVFHGELDDVVPFSESQEMIDALIRVGGKPKFTVYPELKHDSWTETYNNKELYDWMFSQSK